MDRAEYFIKATCGKLGSSIIGQTVTDSPGSVATRVTCKRHEGIEEFGGLLSSDQWLFGGMKNMHASIIEVILLFASLWDRPWNKILVFVVGFVYGLHTQGPFA